MNIDPRGRTVASESSSREPPSYDAFFSGQRWPALVAVLLVSAGLCAVVAYRISTRGQTQLLELLRGGSGNELRQIAIVTGDRSVVCTNRAALAYLEARLRQSIDDDEGPAGRQCELRATFASGTRAAVVMYATQDAWRLFASGSAPGDLPSHKVLLGEPRPDAIRELVEFLLHDERKSGEVLRIE